MANIRERVDGHGKTSFQVQVRLKGYPPQSATFPTKTLAKIWAEQTQNDIRNGRTIRGSSGGQHTLSELLDKYAASELPLKAKGGRNDHAPIAWWRSRLGAYFLNQISPDLIAKSTAELSKEEIQPGRQRTPATVLRYLMVLSHAFSVAITNLRWCIENPVNRVRRPKVKNERTRFLSESEQVALLRSCRESTSPDLYLVVLLAISTGMRKTEILRLQWKDITFFPKDDYAKAKLSDTKNGATRSVMVADPAYALVLARHNARTAGGQVINDKYVFPSPTNHDAPVDIRASWETALTRSGVTGFRFHDLRHTTASYLALDGASLLDIKAVLGHKSTRMSERYAHLTVEHTDEVVRRMNDKRVRAQD